MRPKSGLPKRKAIKSLPCYEHGLRDNPQILLLRKGLERPRKTHSVVSMFAGCGGLDLGLEGGFSFLRDTYDFLPFKTVAAYEINEDACKTYKLNISDAIIPADLTELSESEIPPCDVLTGGFPCQDYSTCGPKTGLDGERGRLYRVMSRYMRRHLPKVVLAENVPGFLSLHGGKIAEEVLSDFNRAGYATSTWQVYCPDYGLPQSRTRIFIVCVRQDLIKHGQPVAPAPTHIFSHISIRQAIYDLEMVKDESVPNQSQYFVATKATAGGGQGDQDSIADNLGFAVRANPKGRVHFHYSLPRRLTVRETARLQSFPDQFVFPHSASKNFMEIGNAVPPIIGHHVGRAIAQYMKGL